MRRVKITIADADTGKVLLSEHAEHERHIVSRVTNTGDDQPELVIMVWSSRQGSVDWELQGLLDYGKGRRPG